MDLKVYTKEEVLQPEGAEYVYVPDVIDIFPELVEKAVPVTCVLSGITGVASLDNGSLYIVNFDNSHNSTAKTILVKNGTASVEDAVYTYATDSISIEGVGTVTNVTDNINSILQFTSVQNNTTLSLFPDVNCYVVDFDSAVSNTYYVFSVQQNNTLELEQLNYNSETDVLALANSNVVNNFSSYLIETDVICECEITTAEYLDNAVTIEKESELIEQECALATIWQKGNDPIDTEDGISWSECILGEINVIQIMQQLIEAVQNITLTVKVSFDAITDSEGQTFLSYTLKAVG